MSESLLEVKPGDPACWRIIGVVGEGDGTCPKLAEVVHCRNCPVFTNAGRDLIERAPPAGYVEEWTTLLAQSKTRAAPRTLAVLVFRVAEEWLAVDAAHVVEIAELRPVHRIPHRPGRVLSGLVNIRGQLLLAVSLHGLLHLEPQPADPARRTPERLVVIQRAAEETWVFRVEEVLGIQRFAVGDVGPVPSTVAHGTANLSRGILPLAERRIGYLDSDALFATLRRTVG